MSLGLTIGSCSRCGGNVTMPDTWAGVQPPPITCSKCGAVPAKPRKPVIEMEPPKCLRPLTVEELASAPKLSKDVIDEALRAGHREREREENARAGRVPFVIVGPAVPRGARYAEPLRHVGPAKSGAIRPWKADQ